jgi:hypothetical protein
MIPDDDVYMYPPSTTATRYCPVLSDAIEDQASGGADVIVQELPPDEDVYMYPFD